MRNRSYFCLKTLLLFPMLFALASLSHAVQPGDVDIAFNPGSGFDGAASTVVVRSDGKLFVAGNFGTVRGASRNSIARLNSDGSVDPTFDPGSGVGYNIMQSGSVLCAASQTDGKMLIGGNFITVNGVSRPSIARINVNGSLDTSFTPSLPQVRSIAVQSDGKILVGHQTGITRLNSNGTTDPTFNATVDARVLSVAIQPDGKIVIGGSFYLVNGTVSSSIARLNTNGSLDVTFNLGGEGFDYSVYCVQIQPDGKMLLCGNFTALNGTNRNMVVRLNQNGSWDSTFNAGSGPGGAYAAANTIALLSNGSILVGGYFNSFNGANYTNNLVRLSGNGQVDPTFYAGAGTLGAISAIAVQNDGRIVLAGDFTAVNGLRRRAVGRLDPDGSLDSTFKPEDGPDASASHATLQSDGKVLISGQFDAIGGTNCNQPVRLNANGSVDNSFSVGTGPHGPVGTGSFGPFGPFVGPTAVQPDGKILVGGGFTSFNGQVRGGLVRLNLDGSVDPTFMSGMTGAVYVDEFGDPAAGAVDQIALQPDGKVIVAGVFFEFNQKDRKGFVRLNNNGTVDDSFNIGIVNSAYWPYFPSFSAIVPQPDGKILLGGDFVSINGTNCNGLIRVSADGSLDLTFVATNALGVSSIALRPDGKVLVAGDLVGLPAPSHIARFNSNGTLDSSFNAVVATNSSAQIALQPDGKIVYSGIYDSYTGNKFIGRLNQDGSADTGFSIAYLNNHLVDGLTLQPDGGVLVGGSFSAVNGVARAHFARLYTTVPPPKLSNSAPFSHGIQFYISGVSNQVVVLEACTNLVNWTPILTNTVGSAPYLFQDPNAIGLPRRFYRARLQ